ncbi:prophage protein, partial [Salmonella enterica subsp. enterica serovar Cubana str. CFSAN001083]
NIYPEEALGEFRRWLREDYVPKGFKDYLADKVQQKVIENAKAIEVLENLQRPELPNKKN